jgi:ABC-type bacteriocin/lantibiotic exporter with double-glycine peptidase domain
LVGLINIKDGEILLNSQNMKNFNILSLRQKIGYVTQDSYLFNGSLRYNISLSNDNDKDKDISSILEMLELKSLFLDEKINLDKNIYDKALNISGGQKQRILIAREMHKKPDVIIFDETLSQLHKDIRLRVFDIVKKLNPQITILNLTHNDEFKKISEQVLEI